MRALAPMQAYADYDDMMALTEDLIRACAVEVRGSPQVGEVREHCVFLI